MMKTELTIREGNLFCYAFDEDAIILNYLFGYKMKNGQIGFPKNSISKITSILDNEKVDYKVIGEKSLEKNFATENQYETILKKAQENNETTSLKEEINEIINLYTKEELTILLNQLKNKSK